MDSPCCAKVIKFIQIGSKMREKFYIIYNKSEIVNWFGVMKSTVLISRPEKLGDPLISYVE